MTEVALEAGAQDLEAIEIPEDSDQAPGFQVYTDKPDLMAVADSVKEAGYSVTEARFIWKPKAPMEISEEDETTNLEAMDMFEELDDVDAVWTNMADPPLQPLSLKPKA
eukprot:CAMPEP_0184315328 /NCGR_PEP_ID=MMETSP1049-20130417/81552_1 /TAXON_ID=77928 /ORGANISM="Proteomonas sulcata, Strain CCMP704" /LENGTH=108 /DNA_ID=CAMNT_0026633741 /DNA_START=8 /DNA_END=335 /DNA_ORIENTATION=+